MVASNVYLSENLLVKELLLSDCETGSIIIEKQVKECDLDDFIKDVSENIQKDGKIIKSHNEKGRLAKFAIESRNGKSASILTMYDGVTDRQFMYISVW